MKYLCQKLHFPSVYGEEFKANSHRAYLEWYEKSTNERESVFFLLLGVGGNIILDMVLGAECKAGSCVGYILCNKSDLL